MSIIVSDAKFISKREWKKPESEAVKKMASLGMSDTDIAAALCMTKERMAQLYIEEYSEGRRDAQQKLLSEGMRQALQEGNTPVLIKMLDKIAFKEEPKKVDINIGVDEKSLDELQDFLKRAGLEGKELLGKIIDVTPTKVEPEDVI